MSHTALHNDHNVYILGAGFGVDAGFPVVRTFLRRMRDGVDWFTAERRTAEVQAIENVLTFLQNAASAAHRTQIDVENVEELFSLASAVGGDALHKDMTLAIAATLDFCRNTGVARRPRPAIAVRDDARSHGPLATVRWRPADQDGMADGWTRYEQPVHDYYAAAMLGYFGPRNANSRSTFITFNYDLSLEDALRELGAQIDYGIPAARLERVAELSAAGNEQRVTVLKLHGSVNWAYRDARSNKMTAFADYAGVREIGRHPILIPPTWRKDFTRQFADVWTQAVQVLREATRVIVIGFSMPETDVHFRYLLAAGLRDNISLRSIVFVDPNKEIVEERALRLLRPELVDRGVLLFMDKRAHEFLLSPECLNGIGRPRQNGVNLRLA